MGKYTLIITEKPDAARRIASALDIGGKPRKMKQNRMSYYMVKRDKEIVVVPALGHLYTVAAAEKTARTRYPVFSFKWVPRYIAEKEAKHIRPWLETIGELAKDADAFIDGCDYDIEGSIIGYNILKYACGDKEKQAKRMKYSTLTKEELEKSYEEPLPNLDFALIEAGLTRHEVDWLYGINLSRALTTAAKNHSGKYYTLSTGRVQGPTLKFIATREKAIKTFVPTPYWELKAQIAIDEQIFEAQYEKEKIEAKHEANNILKACEGKTGIAEKTERKQFSQPPPTPFDFGSLQSEAYSTFGYSPRLTSKIAQRLYLDALTSYPRTSSQKLPPVIDYEAILKNLNKAQEYRTLTAELLSKSELRPHEGKKEDPAHPAIYPTGNLPQRVLGNSGKNLWDLIIRRFMAAFAGAAIRQTVKISINISGRHFYLSGRHTLKEGWLRFYDPYAKRQESFLPQIKEGQPITIRKIISEGRFTKPPPRYNPSSLLRKMEDTEIGTKATRADVIQTLFDRNYVKDEKMTVTTLGFEVLAVLEKYCPTVISTKLTRELEEKMSKIHINNEKEENVIEHTIEILKPSLEKLKENEKPVGEQLSKAIEESKTEERTIGICPTCKTGRLTITYSRKTGKRFVGCTNYFKNLCNTSFPLPQQGIIRPLGKYCPKCSWPTIQVRTRGKHPWILCFNSYCPSKKERSKKFLKRNLQQDNS